MKLFSMLLAGLLFLLPAAAGAKVVPPDVLIKNVTNEVLSIVRHDQGIKSGNPQKAIDLVEAKVLPHFDFTHMTRLAMGRDWRRATPEQQKTLTEEFRTLLVRTYSKALSEYRDQTIAFKPFKLKPGETNAKVRTEIVQTGAKPISLDYYLQKTPQGWKVYDIEVDGISLVVNYRQTFASEVENVGIDGLIKALRAKNRRDAGNS